MTTEPITINVDPEAARLFKNASPEERRKLELKFTLQVLGTAQGTHQSRQTPSPSSESLEALAWEVSRTAQDRGLTLESLQNLLDEDGEQ